MGLSDEEILREKMIRSGQLVPSEKKYDEKNRPPMSDEAHRKLKETLLREGLLLPYLMGDQEVKPTGKIIITKKVLH